MSEIEVPSYFLCPISLEIMKDPVTLSTGITYDREGIERWLFSQNNNTCPATKQLLSDTELTPNITLRRLIQSWCTVHSSHGVERLPTPKSPLTKSHLLKILRDAAVSPSLQMKCLQTLKSAASHQSHTDRRCMIAAGVPQFLASLLVKKTSEEALSILYSLKLPESGMESLKNLDFIESLIRVMRSGSYESRTYAIMLLKSVLEIADPNQLPSLSPEFFIQLTRILSDQISQKASKAALKALAITCPFGRNRNIAAEAGAVPLLINLLLESSDKRACEMVLMVLDLLCQIAEGRADLLKHGAGLAIVAKKILRVSVGASERAIRILFSIAKFSAAPAVLQEMIRTGVVSKLCLVLQVNCGSMTKEKAREILKMHARAWRNASCIPNSLVASYPS